MSDQAGEGLLSPLLRSRRIAAACGYLQGHVLDYGCGSGALASRVDPGRYLGFEIDAESLELARLGHPEHRFVDRLEDDSRKFDTVVSLAVIEHAKDPIGFLRVLAGHLSDAPTARVVITTPHPSADWLHDLGATIGLFSKHANEEHEDLLDREALAAIGTKSHLRIESYSRFMLRCNQIVVYARHGISE
ncbi:MAG: methyltransferase domain-containing protein [Lysobacteraceae bacterium]